MFYIYTCKATFGGPELFSNESIFFNGSGDGKTLVLVVTTIIS